jgi:hypothetical protein
MKTSASPSRISAALTALLWLATVGCSQNAIAADAELPWPAAVQHEIADSAKACGGRFESESGFVSRPDLNADGRRDYVLDYSHAQCSDLASAFCGTGGCLTQIFVSRADGTYVKALDRNVHQITFSAIGRTFRATAFVHGSLCDLPGFKTCREDLQWNGARLKRIRLRSE